MEYTISNRRPDIALLDGGNVIAAIEVFVTHRVSEVKAEHLASLGIPWMEVRASETLYSGETPWDSNNPLPGIRLHPNPVDWKCEACQQRERVAQQKVDSREEIKPQ